MTPFEKRTKIICTIGPASASPEVLERMMLAGMNVARLNFSHGTHEEHARLIKTIREVASRLDLTVALLQDLQGPKIRVGDLPKDGIELKNGERVVFTSSAKKQKGKIPVGYPDLHKDVKAGQRLLLDDGKLVVEVSSVDGEDVLCVVREGGSLLSHKGLNLPDTQTSISSITEKDREDLAFGVSQGVDFIALSFVRSADDLRELKSLIEQEERKVKKKPISPIQIISKIEKPQAVEAFDDILAASDGIMIARGDLGIELPAAKVPVLQKTFIQKCLAAAKPAIVATQMLESMTKSARATRAEISDVANAVIDHVDAVMLSGETAAGMHPVEAVETMSAAIREAEQSAFDDLAVPFEPDDDGGIAHLVAEATHLGAAFVVSQNGQAVRVVARYRPETPILAAVPDARLARQLALSWGVYAKALPIDDHEKAIASLKEYAEQKNLPLKGEALVAIGDLGQSSDHVQFAEIQRA